MRLIIAGPRDFDPRTVRATVGAGVRAWAEHFGFATLAGLEIVSGHSGNVDLAGEAYARRWGIPLELFPYPTDADLEARGMDPRDWTTEQRGPLRNRWMAEYACLEPGGGLLALRDHRRTRGTDSMVRDATRHGLLVLEFAARAQAGVRPAR